MSITMRIVQEFDIRNEKEFMEMEEQFAKLEAARNDYPKARRMQPVSASLPCNTLIWECDFPDIDTAYKTLDFFSSDDEHETLLAKQLPYFKNMRIEFYKNLEF